MIWIKNNKTKIWFLQLKLNMYQDK